MNKMTKLLTFNASKEGFWPIFVFNFHARPKLLCPVTTDPQKNSRNFKNYFCLGFLLIPSKPWRQNYKVSSSLKFHSEKLSVLKMQNWVSRW